jgi:D-alanyl-D-alanine carboxypeptidase/D-alanyl-D-alanine-endopeptidase (penicillin-binding protein 4)
MPNGPLAATDSSGKTLAALAILQADARVAARLTGALSADHRVVVCSSCEELRKALDRGAFDGCLIDVEAPDLEAARREILVLRDRYPGLAIVACIEDGHGQGYFDLGEMGVDGVLPMRSIHNVRLRAVVDGALATARAGRIARTLEGRYAAPGPDAIGWAVENAGGDTSVEKLAAALGHTPRSLRQALEDAGLPGPTRVLLWGRLLLAGARLSRDGRTVEEVAFSLGYSTATSLARAMKRQTGLTPREVSERGGMERVRDALFPGSDGGARPGRRLGKIASIALLAMIASGCATFGLGAASVDRDTIEGILDSPPLDRAHFGVLAVDVESGRTLYARNERQWFVPASNQKILVTAAAWSLLGPDFRFRTELWATGPYDASHLDGDVVLVASGDPSFSSRYWPSDSAAFEAIADSLAAKGPRHVTGALVVDVSAWDSTSVAPTREVADLAYGYGATGGAFAFAEGEIDVVVRPGPEVGAPATIEWSPVGTADYVRSLVTTAAPDSSTRIVPRYLPETGQIVLDGSLPLAVTDTVSIAQRDAVGQATASLARAVHSRDVMTELGTEVRWTEGEPIDGCKSGHVPQCPGARLIATLESPPLSDLVAGVLGPSQNWIAEQLTLALGARLGEGGSWEEGVRVVEGFLSEYVGLDTLDVAARDGSGLSAYNLVTPRALVQVLRYMDARDGAAAYAAAMAEPGEEDSTLEDRLLDLRGRVFAKTGSISNVNSLSGYLVRENGRRVVFAILSNGSALPAQDMRDAIDDVVRVLAR